MSQIAEKIEHNIDTQFDVDVGECQHRNFLKLPTLLLSGRTQLFINVENKIVLLTAYPAKEAKLQGAADL
jgi:hypothetical protein